MFQLDLFANCDNVPGIHPERTTSSQKPFDLKSSKSKSSKSKSFNPKSSKSKLSGSKPSGSKSSALKSTSALPPYSVRESKRAKHVSIKISVEGEVEIVVPPRFDRSRLPEILERRQAWIAKTRSRLLRDRNNTPDDWDHQKPESILFRWRSDTVDDNFSGSPSSDSALETWSVHYQPLPGNQTTCIPDKAKQLTIKGNVDHLPACQAVLRQWLARRAQRDLVPWLRQLSFELDLPCRNISVRGQKTRWASCSSHKDISLNFKLLFLPRPLVHYVLVHELCHTVHMNHSRDFWHLVGEKMPEYKPFKAHLRKGWCYVPRWVENK